MQLKKEPNWFNYSDFYLFVAEHDFKSFVEVGVFLGLSISFLATKIKHKKDVMIYGVDLFDTWAGKDVVGLLDEEKNLSDSDLLKTLGNFKYNFVKDRLKRIDCDNIVELIRQNSWEAAKNFANKSIDFVFIDADHRYESVKKDITSWLPKIKSGGMIAGHDFQEQGVKDAVAEEAGKEVRVFEQSPSCWYMYIK